ncbi:MAG TPA: hypothetical protein VN948_13095 [Terriglobales bacterium]|nr:hypothetical protein [Terriglobales bacterium]
MMAEITLSHLLRLANEHGCSVSREEALAFLNQQGRAFEMWKQSIDESPTAITHDPSVLPVFPSVWQSHGNP